ncbi:hypothetical protein [Arthrobacter bussei]|uniref:Uncharacterized protein n=1 Tax=Arthrobacter bussei TaxID=2594179 RepID=A0A7X1NPP9_9MICC|nr:hypothetical protein [Arthrobacter bussei]MPY10724.1 hypothetical protein [Arthrobacter bussei]
MPASRLTRRRRPTDRGEENRAFTGALILLILFTAWMLSVFTRLGFVFSEEYFPVNHGIAIVILTGMLGSVGLYLELHDARIRTENPER